MPLVELAPAAVVIALAAWFLLPRVLNRESRAPGSASTQIAAFGTALELYIQDNGGPPTTKQGLSALVRRPEAPPRFRDWRGPYLSDVETVPKDPWGREYRYEAPGPGGEKFLIVSYGADGRPGGAGEDSDVSSSKLRTP